MTTATKRRKRNTAQEKLVSALNHPLRVKALTILTERVASPREIARQLGQPLSNVAYHVRVLEQMDLIELVEEEKVRGAVQHFFRAVARPLFDTGEWERLDPAVRSAVSGYALELIISDAAKALRSGTFDAREDRHLSRTPLLLDQAGWNEIASIQGEALQRILDVQASSAARMNDSGEEGVHAIAAMICFEMPAKGK